MKKLLSLFLAVLFLVPISITGCSTTSPGGVELIEELSPERYDQVVRYTKIGVSFGLGQLLDRNIIKTEDRWVLGVVVQTLRDVAEAPASESVGNLLTEALGRVEVIQEYAKAEYIIAVLAVAENFVLDRGGFSVVRQSDGTWALSDRTKGILLAVAEGVEEALASTSELNPEGSLRSTIQVTPRGNAELGFQRAQFIVYGPNNG